MAAKNKTDQKLQVVTTGTEDRIKRAQTQALVAVRAPRRWRVVLFANGVFDETYPRN